MRFWGVLGLSLLIAWVLGRTPYSPLKKHEWMLLAIGLTQVPLPASLVVVAWLFALKARGRMDFANGTKVVCNLLQVALVFLTVIAIGIFITIVAAGLLGHPDMFIQGNASSQELLRWYEARVSGGLPQPMCLSISIWWYRLAMLLWALWLASSLIRWLLWGWQQFTTGGYFRVSKKSETPPPLPKSTAK